MKAKTMFLSIILFVVLILVIESSESKEDVSLTINYINSGYYDYSTYIYDGLSLYPIDEGSFIGDNTITYSIPFSDELDVIVFYRKHLGEIYQPVILVSSLNTSETNDFDLDFDYDDAIIVQTNFDEIASEIQIDRLEYTLFSLQPDMGDGIITQFCHNGCDVGIYSYSNLSEDYIFCLSTMFKEEGFYSYLFLNSVFYPQFNNVGNLEDFVLVEDLDYFNFYASDPSFSIIENPVYNFGIQGYPPCSGASLNNITNSYFDVYMRDINNYNSILNYLIIESQDPSPQFSLQPPHLGDFVDLSLIELMSDVDIKISSNESQPVLNGYLYDSLLGLKIIEDNLLLEPPVIFNEVKITNPEGEVTNLGNPNEIEWVYSLSPQDPTGWYNINWTMSNLFEDSLIWMGGVYFDGKKISNIRRVIIEPPLPYDGGQPPYKRSPDLNADSYISSKEILGYISSWFEWIFNF